MITLRVPDMSCSHCSGVITKAVKQLDPSAEVGFDMHNHMIQVQTTKSTAALIDALNNAGYPATPV
jgi:copper chaperone